MLGSKTIFVSVFISFFLLIFGYVLNEQDVEVLNGMGIGWDGENLTINESNQGLLNQTVGMASSGYDTIGTSINGLGLVLQFIRNFFQFLYSIIHTVIATGQDPIIIGLITIIFVVPIIFAVASFIRGVLF